ncbi:MAG: TldD/PmbA family protein, partial [candidate division Zixibacteria bacterium]
MIGREKILKLLDSVAKKSKANTTEILFMGSDSGLTRYANSCIHQNVAESDGKVTFRVSVDRKIGTVTTNILDEKSLLKSLESAIEIAGFSRPNKYFKGVAPKSKIKRIKTHFESTAVITPAGRAKIVGRICGKASRKGLNASGAFSTSETEIAFVNSNGVRLYQPLTSAVINMVIASDNSSGYSQGISRRIEKIDFDSLLDKAIGKCELSKDPVGVEPGKYDVFLEPAAVANLLEWLSFIGLGAVGYHEKTSFLSGKNKKRVMASSVNLYDDGLDSSGIAFPFDFEGVGKSKVHFVRNGLGGRPVYDLINGSKNKTKSTGHGMLFGSTGPIPLNLFMAPGKKPMDDIRKGIKKGILVTRFHYINGYLDTTRAVMTGMTRDGTFLVEDGKITKGVKNLRFTESITRAFSNILAVSKETELCDTWWSDIGCVSAPALLIKDFT